MPESTRLPIDQLAPLLASADRTARPQRLRRLLTTAALLLGAIIAVATVLALLEEWAPTLSRAIATGSFPLTILVAVGLFLRQRSNAVVGHCRTQIELHSSPTRPTDPRSADQEADPEPT